MKKLILLCATLSLAIPATAPAHPVGVAYKSRGSCEAAFADSSKSDRDRLVQRGVFDTKGAAQRTFNELFECQYDDEEQAWFIVFIGA